MTRIIFVVTGLVFLTGCATVNFSANYYTPPAGYRAEVAQLFEDVTSRLPLKNKYEINQVDEQQFRKLHGIPSISHHTVYLPDDFVKYVFQNYYNDRATIFTNVFVHELCHPEYGVPEKPPAKHAQADLMAIKLLGDTPEAAVNAYRSLFVVKNYWFARKGMAGHALNMSWNAANAASLFFGGPAFFGDLYGTDLSQRMKIVLKTYKLKSPGCFTRSVQTP